MHVYTTYYAVKTRHLINKLEYLLETKNANRLLLVLGVMSPKTKGPFIFLTFSFFTPHVRHFKHVFSFRCFRRRIFSLFVEEFRNNLRFFSFSASCTMQKCEFVLPEQCISIDESALHAYLFYV